MQHFMKGSWDIKKLDGKNILLWQLLLKDLVCGSTLGACLFLLPLMSDVFFKTGKGSSEYLHVIVVAATFPKPKLSSLSYLFIHLETLHMLQYLYQGGPVNVPYLAKRFSWIQLYRNYMSKNRFLPPTLLPGPGLLVTYFHSRYFFVTGLFCVAVFCAEMAALLPILEH